MSNISVSFSYFKFTSLITEILQTTDKDMIYKQKFFLEMCYKVWEPMYFEEYKTLSHFVWDKSYYTKYTPEMEYFYETYKTVGTIPRGMYISWYDKDFLKEVHGLFQFFYHAKDFETLQKNMVWAREYMNENVYFYAMQIFVYHHPEYKYIVLPALYEVFPFYFYNGKFIYTTKGFDFDLYKYQEAYEHKYLEHFKKVEPFTGYYHKYFDWYAMKFHYVEGKKILRNVNDMQGQEKYHEFFESLKMFWVKADYSHKYETFNDEFKLDYLTEDFDWNMYWYNYFIMYPVFLHEKEYGMDGHGGEYFFHRVHQVLARYYAERYAHGMDEVTEFSWYTPVEEGYHPQMVYHSGLPYSYRPNYYEYKYFGDFTTMNVAESFEYRIRHVLDKGYYTTADGKKFWFNKPESVEMIGEMFLGTADTVDRKFFGNWVGLFHGIVGGADEAHFATDRHFYDYVPHVMTSFATCMRDPLFYQIYTRLYDIFFQYNFRLGHYTQEELKFPGVKMNNVHVDKFVTYFDLVDTDVSVLLNKNYFFHEGKFNWEYAAFGRRHRLNNKPFVITYDFESDKAQKIVFRTFLGPKYDQHGKEFTLDYARQYFYEIDQFYYEAVAGHNTHQRESSHYFETSKDFTTYFELYKTMFAAFEGKYQFPVDSEMNQVCGFPHRLLLPKGNLNGLEMKMYVIATPFDTTVKEYSYEQHMAECGYEYDNFSYGFPLDRPIDLVHFFHENMYFTDVMIYHDQDFFHYPEGVSKYFYDYKFIYWVECI